MIFDGCPAFQAARQVWKRRILSFLKAWAQNGANPNGSRGVLDIYLGALLMSIEGALPPARRASPEVFRNR